MQIKKLILFIFLVPSLIFSQDINIQSLKSMSDENLKMYDSNSTKRIYAGSNKNNGKSRCFRYRDV